VGVSACLLGERVRYDGGHKQNDVLTDLLSPQVDWIPVCPEVEVGMGTPRPPLHLLEEGGRVRLVTTSTGDDHTERMARWLEQRLEQLAAEELSGYVLKKNSPSCGPDGVKIFDISGAETAVGSGLFAAGLRRRFPDLPVEDEARLADPDVRRRFIERVIAYSQQHYR
jgi:uncharacterized protein YbbK (DUF523 family)